MYLANGTCYTYELTVIDYYCICELWAVAVSCGLLDIQCVLLQETTLTVTTYLRLRPYILSKNDKIQNLLQTVSVLKKGSFPETLL
jgi:hypothetical protein